MIPRRVLGGLSSLLFFAAGLHPAAGQAEWKDLGSDELEHYFAERVSALEAPMRGIDSREGWEERRPEYRRQLLEMLGLDPLPERAPLQGVVTGKVVREEFTVENLHFQSSPGLYVTGNLYLPAKPEGKVPAVLYVCGHGPTVVDGVSHGNKVSYQHHGIWFARNGYACLVIDSLQLGEIEGIHHGLYRYNRWWWISRGYTPAGVEAWNCMRALDYLQSREEIDGERLGVTGRSGGGAYSWWIAALDERIKCAVPVAGITSLRDHVVHGCVEGHCDCMYMLNSYGWDFEQVAALVAPRALLLSNTDKDSIFPIEGVSQVFFGTRRIYELLGAGDRLGLNIEEGPHEDTQPLRTAAFHWMNRHLQGAGPADTFEMAAVAMLEPAELKVFQELPADEINTRIDELFVPVAGQPAVPENAEQWEAMKAGWMTALRDKCFRGWPDAAAAPQLEVRAEGSREGRRSVHHDLVTEPHATCSLTIEHDPRASLREISHCTLIVGDDPDRDSWDEGLDAPGPGEARVILLPRGVGGQGPGHGVQGWPAEERKRTQIRRRFPLVGQSLDAMRAFDIVQAVRALREILPEEAAISMHSEGTMAGNVLYASLFLDQPVQSLELRNLPVSHHDGPFYLSVLKVLDLPQAVAMAADRTDLRLIGASDDWAYPQQVAEKLGWPAGRLVVEDKSARENAPASNP